MEDDQPDAIVLHMPEEVDPLSAEVTDLVSRFGFEAVLHEVEMHQPRRSVPSAPARHTDPETSHLAAKQEPDLSRFRATSRQGKLLLAFSSKKPMTDQEATLRVVGSSPTPSQFDGCRRRCSDLRAVGYLADSGLRANNPGSSDESIVWRISNAGMAAASRLRETGWSR